MLSSDSSNLQLECIQKMMKFGWVPDLKHVYVHPEELGSMYVLRTIDNIAMVYPDGSIDRPGHGAVESSAFIRPRDGWFCPTDKRGDKTRGPSQRNIHHLKSSISF